MASPNTSHRARAEGRIRGFTLIEIIVVITLMATILSIGLLMSMDVFRGTTFRSTRQVLVSALTTARSRALANVNQSPYGVCYQAPDFIVFQGKSYGLAGTDSEKIPGNPAVTLSSTANFFNCTGSGATGIVFSQVAATSTGGTITVSESGHADETISVNAQGTIIW